MSQITTKTPITDQEPNPVCLSPHIYMSFVSRSSPASKQTNHQPTKPNLHMWCKQVTCWNDRHRRPHWSWPKRWPIRIQRAGTSCHCDPAGCRLLWRSSSEVWTILSRWPKPWTMKTRTAMDALCDRALWPLATRRQRFWRCAGNLVNFGGWFPSATCGTDSGSRRLWAAPPTWARSARAPLPHLPRRFRYPTADPVPSWTAANWRPTRFSSSSWAIRWLGRERPEDFPHSSLPADWPEPHWPDATSCRKCDWSDRGIRRIWSICETRCASACWMCGADTSTAISAVPVPWTDCRFRISGFRRAHLASRCVCGQNKTASTVPSIERNVTWNLPENLGTESGSERFFKSGLLAFSVVTFFDDDVAVVRRVVVQFQNSGELVRIDQVNDDDYRSGHGTQDTCGLAKKRRHSLQWKCPLWSNLPAMSTSQKHQPKLKLRTDPSNRIINGRLGMFR